MDLLLILLVGIIGILIFLLLKKERVFGIKEENKIENKTLKNEVVTDNKENIYKLFNYIPEAIIILNKSKEILFSNSSAQKRFEISKNNNINSYLRNPDLIKAIEDAFIGKNPKDLEIEVKNRAMQRMNITIYFDSNNLFFNEPNCLLFIRDLTEFYKFQELKSDFVANVSHELRTPLQSIKMGLETFENNESLKNNSEIKDFLPVMISQSERMENLIRDLLSLSKIELQEHIRPTHEIDLNNVIEYVIKTHEKILNKHQIQIQFKKVNDFKIIGDNDKLIEIFTNLIDNAIKYSEKIKKIAISGKKENKLNIVSVTDEGVGIPKEYLHRVTERFFTVDPSKSRSVGGTGLGLAIVKHLVSQHRGEMNITSVENKGTTIELKFNSL